MATLALKEFYLKKMDSNSETEVQSKSHLRIVYLLPAFILSIAGAALAFYATALTIRLSFTGIGDQSGCSYSNVISCDAVLSTEYAMMFAVPAAWWGFLFYVWAAGAMVYGFLKRNSLQGKGALYSVAGVSVIACLVSLFKMYQLIEIGVVCPVCIGMYVMNFGVLFFSLKAGGESFRSVFGKLSRFFTGKAAGIPHPVRYAVFLVWVFGMGFLGMRYYENIAIKPSEVNVRAILTQHYSQKPVDIITENAPITGNRDAKVRIVEFSDFECPACKLLSQNLKTVMMEYGDKVSLEFVNYPLDKSINANVKNELHKNAGLAALAGLAAERQGKFREYQQMLFENQTNLDRENLIRFAGETGMDVQKFTDDMDSGELRGAVIRDIEEGKSAGVTGTPFLFINGRKVENWNSIEVIRSIIKSELSMNSE